MNSQEDGKEFEPLFRHLFQLGWDLDWYKSITDKALVGELLFRNTGRPARLFPDPEGTDTDRPARGRRRSEVTRPLLAHIPSEINKGLKGIQTRIEYLSDRVADIDQSAADKFAALGESLKLHQSAATNHRHSEQPLASLAMSEEGWKVVEASFVALEASLPASARAWLRFSKLLGELWNSKESKSTFRELNKCLTAIRRDPRATALPALLTPTDFLHPKKAIPNLVDKAFKVLELIETPPVQLTDSPSDDDTRSADDGLVNEAPSPSSATKGRLRFDRETYSVYLDEKRIGNNVPPVPYQLFHFLAIAEGPVHLKTAVGLSKGLRGKNHTRELDKLKSAMRKLVRSDDVGHYIVLPARKVKK